MLATKGNIANSGQLFEEEILGHCRVSWNGEYLPWGKAVWQVRKNQPWNTFCPEILFLRTVLDKLKKELRISAEFYTAVGTALDVYHGVDGYFYFRGIMVTVDASLRNKNAFRTDLLLGEEDTQDPSGFAHRVADSFREKMRRAWTGGVEHAVS